MEAMMLAVQHAAIAAAAAAPASLRAPPRRAGFVRPRVRGGVGRRRDLSAAGLGSFFGFAAGDHKNHEVDDLGTVKLFVGLPIDSVMDGAAVHCARAIAAGVRAMKLLGVDGVELPVFWSVVQPESPERFVWAGYRAVADMVRAEGLSLRVSLHFHGSPGGDVPAIPTWVSAAAAADPDILFTDRSGGRHEDCLSFAVDELPVLAGASPLDRYEAFFRSFAGAFGDLFGATITQDVTVGLGPNGELRYPSYPPASDASKFTGVGEFQCYDKYMLARLRRHGEDSGHALWGLSGPHDAPRYDESPHASGFFREDGGSWESPYGDFFLSWYAGELVSHGDRVLAAAGDALQHPAVALSAKVPFMHWWHGARSRPAEAAAGFYKSGGGGAGRKTKNGYSPVAAMFARRRCAVVVPGMDVCMNKQRRSTGSSPDQLLAQIKAACRRHGARIAGENASLVMTHTSSFARIRGNLLTADAARPCHFTYQRMGADFFSPEHWPAFVEFVRGVVAGEWDDDDWPADDDVAAPAKAKEARAA